MLGKPTIQKLLLGSTILLSIRLVHNWQSMKPWMRSGITGQDCTYNLILQNNFNRSLTFETWVRKIWVSKSFVLSCLIFGINWTLQNRWGYERSHLILLVERNKDLSSFCWPFVMILKGFMGQFCIIDPIDSVVSKLLVKKIRLKS